MPAHRKELKTEAEKAAYALGYQAGKARAESKLIQAEMTIEYLRGLVNQEVPRIPKFTV